ncbi:MAG: WD40 repeat domain-containing protein, partial [Planctomycetaceae bacterium]|nr:WD40 repeat domain-containing protein [Planctomycetaceae bacterium]
MKPVLLLVATLILLLFTDSNRLLFAQQPRRKATSVTAIAVDGGGRWLATASHEQVVGAAPRCVIRFWDIENETLVSACDVETGSIATMSFSTDTKLMAIDDLGQQYSLSPTAKNVERLTAPPMPGTRIAVVNPDTHRLLTIDDRIRLWEDGKVAVTASSPDELPIVDATFLAGGSHLAIATAKNTIWLHPRTFRELIHPSQHADPLTAFSVSGSEWGMVTFTGHNNGNVEYWHAGRGVLRRTIRAHPNSVTHVAAYANGTRCVSLGDDGLLKFWEAETGKKLAEEFVPDSNDNHLASSVTGRVIALVSGNEAQIRTLDPSRADQVAKRWVFPVTGETPVEPMPKLPNLNLLRNWKTIRGDWKIVDGRIV